MSGNVGNWDAGARRTLSRLNIRDDGAGEGRQNLVRCNPYPVCPCQRVRFWVEFAQPAIRSPLPLPS